MNFESDYNYFKKTWSVKTELPVEFKLIYSADIFNPNNQDIINVTNSNRRIIVIDSEVYDLYKDNIARYFDAFKLDCKLICVDCKEENKNWKNVDRILDFFEENGVLRREPIITIGGGVLLDIAGFACSIYRRGIPYIKIPTTLLAIVDASVGSKVGVNHIGRRNRIGAYYPPLATYIDKKFIATQSEREIVNGIAEIFKLAVIKSPELFRLLEENAEILIKEKFQYGAVPVRVINVAITDMIEELGPNLWEKRLDRCVDFGHTFSPVIEMSNIPDLLHGEAVALDCLFSSCIAFQRGYLEIDDLKRIFSVAKRLKLKTFHEDFTNMIPLKESLSDATKHRNGNQYVPLPISIGNYKIVNDITDREMMLAIDIFEEL
jgi:2-epi-5-epi-valiolone synthase